METKFRKGQHVIVKYHGKNGDLIAGRIESVRSNGDVILTNLITGSRATKHADVLAARNEVVPKRIAERVQAESKKGPAAARRLAVELHQEMAQKAAEELNAQQPIPFFPSAERDSVADAVRVVARHCCPWCLRPLKVVQDA